MYKIKKGSNTLIIGAQWGDEGKAAVISDLLKKLFETYKGIRVNVIKFIGGSNAGHTEIVDGEKFIFHLLPSGVIFPNTVNIIGKAVVFDPVIFFEELKKLGNKLKGEIFIDPETPLVLPIHKLIDEGREKKLGKGAIGTTLRGIGPAYEDKCRRPALKVGDLADMSEEFIKKLEVYYNEKVALLRYLDPELAAKVKTFDKFLIWCGAFGEALKGYITDTGAIVRSSGSTNIFEGSQGVMLDVDHGTYPFVTSSSCVAGIINSFGYLPIDDVIGVVKAYTTRVGNGPFPTELKNETGDHLREKGGEFGSTTGRPRRCGDFDSPVVQYACQIAGITKIVLTKLDVISGLSKVSICTEYKIGDRLVGKNETLTTRVLEKVEPVYDERPGWLQDISGCTKYSQLPSQAKKYVGSIQGFLDIPIIGIKVGPEQNQIIWTD